MTLKKLLASAAFASTVGLAGCSSSGKNLPPPPSISGAGGSDGTGGTGGAGGTGGSCDQGKADNRDVYNSFEACFTDTVQQKQQGFFLVAGYLDESYLQDPVAPGFSFPFFIYDENGPGNDPNVFAPSTNAKITATFAAAASGQKAGIELQILSVVDNFTPAATRVEAVRKSMWSCWCPAISQ